MLIVLVYGRVRRDVVGVGDTKNWVLALLASSERIGHVSN
jgi:hypothetical protein